MLEGSGYRVHVYTSPHLVHFHERIRLAGSLISDEELAATLEECERANKGLPSPSSRSRPRLRFSPSRATMPTRRSWK